MLIVITEDARGRWRTNLTNQVIVTRRRKHATAGHAAAEVAALLRAGHVPAFRSALRDLERAVPLAPPPDLPALDNAAD